MEFLKQFKAARRVSTPLVAVRTFDSKSTIGGVKSLFKKEDIPPMLVWDCVTGYRSLTQAGTTALETLLSHTQTMPEATLDLPTALRILEAMNGNPVPADCLVFISNIHLFWSEPSVLQSIWNLRDTFKSNGNMLVLLTNQGATLPQELTHDILVLDEPLPSLETLEKIVRDTFESAGMTAPDADTLKLATDALIGLPFFPAEQSTAMCLDTIGDEGLNISDLWDRKRQQINQTNGLSVGTGKESLAEIGGLENVKEYMERLLGGNDAPRCIIFSDEIEKAFAGTGTDMSGVKTALTGAMLSWTQDQDMSGVLWFGVPGGGKSQLGKAIAAHHNIPFIKFDLDGMQSGIVGSSGSNLRSAQATVDAVASGKVLWIATCNSVDALPAELQARFKDGSFFFDTPTKEERATIWAIYRSKFGIPATDATPSDEGWTGREIKECCSKAYRLRLSLEAASKYVVPVTISRADLIENIRRNASGKYISASQPGLYHYAPPQSHAIATTAHQEAVTGRKMRNE